MKLQAFIFNWRGHEERAVKLQSLLGDVTEVLVINSEDAARCRHPDWIHVGESAYFSAQWNAAIKRFNADVLFHIQADASHPNLPYVLDRAKTFLARADIGVYEPNVDYTDLRYHTDQLRPITRDVYEVPLTDCTCWFIRGDILAEFSPVDLTINRYGWGVPAVVAAKCRLQQRICVRDYTTTVYHPRRRGYPSDAALGQRNAYFRTFGLDDKDALRAVYADFSVARIPISPPLPQT